MDKYLACLFILCFYNVLNRGVVGSTMREWQFRGTSAESTKDRSEDVCSNGDVKLENDGSPFIYWDNEWVPICGHYFWNNQEGAKLICKKMGYMDGSLFASKHKYISDSFRVGKCNAGDTLKTCTGSCNDYQKGGFCSNNPLGKCDKSQNVGIEIKCTGGDSSKTSSCEEATSSCDDEIMNGDEEGVDCGGSCNQCLCRYISKSACQEEYARNACPTLCQELLDN